MIYKVKVLWICFFLIFKNNVECDNIRLELYKYFVLWIYLFERGVFNRVNVCDWIWKWMELVNWMYCKCLLKFKMVDNV